VKNGQAKRLSAFISDYLATSGLASTKETNALWIAWQTVVGEDVAEHTRLLGLRAGVLSVEVDSAVWLQELRAAGTSSLVPLLREQLKGSPVSEIDLKLGTF